MFKKKSPYIWTNKMYVHLRMPSILTLLLIILLVPLLRLINALPVVSNEIRTLLANNAAEWHFNPSSAPHFGPHWEAGVKSIKYRLKRVIGNILLTYEKFTTVGLLIQIETVLSSRPLCRLTENPDDRSFLTPADFLVGEPLSSLPELNVNEIPMTYVQTESVEAG